MGPTAHPRPLGQSACRRGSATGQCWRFVWPAPTWGPSTAGERGCCHGAPTPGPARICLKEAACGLQGRNRSARRTGGPSREHLLSEHRSYKMDEAGRKDLEGSTWRSDQRALEGRRTDDFSLTCIFLHFPNFLQRAYIAFIIRKRSYS